MIMLLDETYQVIEKFRTDAGLFQHLQNSFETLDEQIKYNWQFVRYPYKTLAPFVKDMQGRSFVDMARQACQQEYDLIVMCKGDEENPDLFLLTPDLDVTALRKEWCKLYCKAHNLIILTE